MSSKIENPALDQAQRYLRWSARLFPLLYVLMVATLYGAFQYAPTEQIMGEVQRIFYVHFGAAWNTFLAFFVVALGGAIYLIKRNPVWDQIAAASAEIGVILNTIVLMTGSIWARPVWNTWWPWGDPRVTTMLVLWLIYVAYLILRNSLPEGEKKYRFCAVFGIIGFLDVPIVYMSIHWWRTMHPVVITAERVGLEREMIHTLFLSVPAFTVLYLCTLFLRTAMRLHRSMADELAQQILE